MEAKAVAKGVRLSPDRARLVIDLIRGKDVNVALAILKNTNKTASRVIEKVLVSATSNAVNNLKLDENNLMVKECFVDAGPVLKRGRPGSRGYMDKNYHRTSHITVIVASKS